MIMKPGHIYRLKDRPDDAPPSLVTQGESSSEEWGCADAAKEVERPGGADVVYVIKVLAVVRRSAKVEQ